MTVILFYKEKITRKKNNLFPNQHIDIPYTKGKRPNKGNREANI